MRTSFSKITPADLHTMLGLAFKLEQEAQWRGDRRLAMGAVRQVQAIKSTGKHPVVLLELCASLGLEYRGRCTHGSLS